MARIVLNPFGSFGDLHPYMALALALQQRGHDAVIATSAAYQNKVEAEGMAFAPVRPDVGELMLRPDLIEKLWDRTDGTQFLLRRYLLPQVEAAFHDLLPVCESADLLITHMAAFAGPVVADARQLPWLSVALQPSALFSRHDVLVVPEAPWLRHLYRLGPWLTNLMLSIGDSRTRHWAEPVHALRRKLQLPPRENPIMQSQFSPFGTLALFSRHFAPAQRDWPAKTVQPGFLFYDRAGAVNAEPEWGDSAADRATLERFLSSGPAPLLFTLGSSAVMQAGDFFHQSRRAARILRQRAILLVGRHAAAAMSEEEGILTAPYLPFSHVMPRVSAIIHQGGIGTCAQVLRAGRPSLVVPWSHDQPDNAHRLFEKGVARLIWRHHYSAKLAARSLRRIMADPNMDERARSLGAAISGESALESACDTVERTLLAQPAQPG